MGLELGFNTTAFDANRNGLIVNANALKGFQLNPVNQLFLTSTFTSRWEGGQARNLILDGTASYYWRWRSDRVLYVFLGGTTTRALDPESQLVIGGDNGLRGYPLRYQSGERRVLMTAEARAFTDIYLWRLVRVGGAAFYDVGRAWGGPHPNTLNPGWLSNVGIGLRFFSVRAAFGNVLHVDIARPLQRDPSIRSTQFLVKTKTSF
mgnify:CR=1 FL=1